MKTGYQAGGTTHALLRIVAGLLFMLHGGQKLFGWFGGPGGDGGTVELASLMGLAGILELVGGALIILGLFTRPVAFVLSGEMAFAYFIGHAPKNLWPVLNGGDTAILYCFVWLYLSAAGPGPWSLDAVLRRGGTGPTRADGSVATHRPRSAA